MLKIKSSNTLKIKENFLLQKPTKTIGKLS